MTRGLLHGLREDASVRINLNVMSPRRTPCMLWKMWLLWLLVMKMHLDLDNTSNGKQIFFDIFLDTLLLRKNMIFTEKCQMNYRLCADLNSTGVKIGKKPTALLRRGSPLQDMYPNGAVEMKLVFDCCGYYVNLAQTIQVWKTICSFYSGQQQATLFCWGRVEQWLDFWAEICCHGRFTLDCTQGTLNRNSSTNWECPQVVQSWIELFWMDVSCDRSEVWKVNSAEWFEKIQAWFLAFLCMTMMVRMVILEKEQEQRHQGH